MKVAVLGTGMVGQTFAQKLASQGHQVMMGTRNVKDTKDRQTSNNNFGEWLQKNPDVNLGTFADAVSFGEIVFNVLNGGGVKDAINACNKSDFDEKIIIDISNPLDFSKGFPPTLSEGLNNSNSLGEEIQTTLPNAKVVKTLNTMNCNIMVDPSSVNGGKHTNFICGNNAEAKEQVKSILNSFGWDNENILDLGDISNARGTEGIVPLWARIYNATQTATFNFQIMK